MILLSIRIKSFKALICLAVFHCIIIDSRLYGMLCKYRAVDLDRRQASQFVHEHGDQVCPANWTPGEETIEPSLDLVGQL